MNGSMNDTTLWTSDEAARATASVAGKATEPWTATGVSINTRTLKPGDLFVALKGPTFDGHDYVETAFGDGAAAAVVSKPCKAKHPLLEVSDTQAALEASLTSAGKVFSVNIFNYL